MNKILVIKLGALGDFLQAMGPFKAIRDHHKQDHIILLTTPFYKDLAEKSGYFDEVWALPRLKGRQIFKIIGRLLKIKAGKFQYIYDLQTSSHTSRYFYLLKLLGWRGVFSGIAKGCSHPHKDPSRDLMHTLDRQRSQLKDAELDYIPFPDISFLLKSPRPRYFKEISKPYVLLVAGGAPNRPEKRWPLDKWKTLIQRFEKMGITSVLIGSTSERDLEQSFGTSRPYVQNLIGKTSIEDLAHLGKHALLAVGNDTGPMHLFSLIGCRAIVLFNLFASDPKLCGPRSPKKGKNVCYITEKDLNKLKIDRVWESLVEFGLKKK